jgi:hypothetical protein
VDRATSRSCCGAAFPAATSNSVNPQVARGRRLGPSVSAVAFVRRNAPLVAA